MDDSRPLAPDCPELSLDADSDGAQFLPEANEGDAPTDGEGVWYLLGLVPPPWLAAADIESDDPTRSESEDEAIAEDHAA